jgi:tetraacyldisaccharide 4'-kinase
MNWQALQRSRIARAVLWPLSLLYGVAASARARAYADGRFKSRRLRSAVVSVGSLSVGGAGKTPMVLWLAEKFIGQGKRVAVLTRGYRGQDGTSDEVELLRNRLGARAMVAMGADRFAVASALEAKQPVDVFLLDDGFQHLQLARDVDILLMDASRSLTGEALLPAGSLREPISAMGRADALVFTRAEIQPGISSAASHLADYPVFTSTTKLLGFRRFGSSDTTLLPRDQIGVGPFLAFCGLGHPQQFFRDLENWNISATAHSVFPDHHRYNAVDGARLERAAERANARGLITTEKDANNLKNVDLRSYPVFVAVIDIEVSPEADFLSLIAAKIAERGGSAA